MALTNAERKEIAHIIEITVTPLLVDLGATLLDEVKKINLNMCEMLAKIFQDRTGTFFDGMVAAQKKERERIIIQTKQAAQTKSARLGFVNKAK